MAADGSVWRTRLVRSVLAWMVLSVLLILGLGPLGELLADAPLLHIVTLLIALPGLLLFGWGVVAVIRAPRRNWPTPLLVIGFSAALLFAAEPLVLAGARLHFMRREATYERILAEGQAGRLAMDEAGWARGRRYGVPYEVKVGDNPGGLFRWGTEPWGFFGILYDEYECHGRSPPPSPPPPPPPTAQPGADPPTIKNAGRLSGGYYRPLSRKACLFHIVG